LAALAVGAFACSNDNNNGGNDASVSTGGSGGSAGRAGSAGVSGGGSSGKGGSAGSGGSTGTSDAASPDGGGRGGAAGAKSDAGIPDASMSEAGLSDAGVLAFSAGEWIALLDTVNHAEVAQGQLADTKASAADVKAFADEMVTAHTLGLEKDSATATELGVTAKQTKVSAHLKAQGKATLAALNQLSAAAFDRAYMQAQVTEHAAVLALLDVGIISMGGTPDASTPDATAATPLLTLLEQTRAVVREHLRMANGIVAGLP
jgi:predicted outer membrane protein